MIYAGINSSVRDRENGKNEHFRVFGLEVPAGAKKGGKATTSKISELSRSALFDGTEKETYQRLIRLSMPFPDASQLGATATAFGSKVDEVVLFDTTGSPTVAPKLRGRIRADKEAEDLDIIQTGKDEYVFAYCTKYDIFVKTVSPKKDSSDPRLIATAMTKHEIKQTPILRSLRFLSPEFLLTLENLSGRKGAVLQILRLPKSDNDKTRQVTRTHLPAHVRQATGLAICNLSPRSSPSSEQGVAQFVIAVAGHEMSISIYTMEYRRQGPVSMVTKPKLLRTLKDIHPFQITGLALSIFVPPTSPTSSLNIKLASISAGNTVVVHTLPLSPVPKSSPSRYAVSGTTNTSLLTFDLFVSIFAILTIAFFAQVALEIRGSSPAYLNMSNYVAPDVQDWFKVSHPIANRIFGTPKPAISSTLSTVMTTPTTSSHAGSSETSFASILDALLSQQAEKSSQGGNSPMIIVREHLLDVSAEGETIAEEKSAIMVDLHDESVHGPHGGKTWEELTKEERERWTKKFKDAGHWTEDYMETILKGVVFGMAGAAVGAAVGG